jgi:hypothetical protein
MTKIVKCRIYSCDSKIQALDGGPEGPGGYLPDGWKITRSQEEERAKAKGKPTCPKHLGSNDLTGDRLDRRKLEKDEYFAS